MDNIPKHIFRANDIRGIANSELSDSLVIKIAKAYCQFLKERSIQRLAIGCDVRHSSPRIKNIFIQTSLESGLDIIDLGSIPTPIGYFACYHYTDIPALVIITASHNPSEYNGFKFTFQKQSITKEEIQSLYQMCVENSFSESNSKGNLETRNPSSDYLKYVSFICKKEKQVKVVIDPANATGCLIAEELYKKCGYDVITINGEVDGTFPNHHPDPTVRANLIQLQEKVLECEAEVGIGFDGDSDRIGVVDNQGRFIPGDILTAIFAQDILKKNVGGSVVFEVKSSQTLIDTIQKADGIPHMTPVGHGYIKRKIQETNALLAGELSGHMFFTDRYYGYDDAFYCGLRLLELLSHSNLKLSEIFDSFPQLHTSPEIHIRCKSDQEKFDLYKTLESSMDRFEDVLKIDGLRIQFKNGWALVRPSNTSPVIVTRYEANTEQELTDIRNQVESIINLHTSNEKVEL